MPAVNRRWLAFIAVCVVVLVSLLLVHFARAHDHDRPELTPWFKALKSKAGALCCDGTDATRLEDVDWDSKDGHYRVRINGQWVDVPDNAVIEAPNRAGQAMVWLGTPTFVRCFMPGSMT